MAKFILDGQEYGGGGSGSNIVKLTQAEYDALSNDKLSNDIIYLITDSGELAAENLFYDGSQTGLGNNVQDAIDSCFQSVSNGKALVASAITDKNVPTDATATFEQMATNIRNIETGIDTSGATATSADITDGKTAWVNGELIVGTRPAPVISQTGSINTGTVPNLNSKTLNVTFKEKFETVPKVKASSSNSHITITNIFNITETGFSITVFKDSADTGGFTATIYWTATA